MKNILLFLITLLPALAISQVEYDTVTVIDPEDFLLVSEVDTSQIQFFSKKAGTWRRVNPQTVKDWIKPDSLVFDADTLYLYSGGSATPLKVFLPDLNGIYSGNGTVPSGTYVEQLGPLRFDIDSFGSFAVGDFDELTTGALFSISNYAGNNGKVTIRSGSGAGFTDATVEVNGYDLPRKSATAEGLAPGQYVWIVDQSGNFVGEDSTGWINKDDVGRNGLFDASNSGDTVRISTALLRAALSFLGSHTTRFQGPLLLNATTGTPVYPLEINGNSVGSTGMFINNSNTNGVTQIGFSESGIGSGTLQAYIQRQNSGDTGGKPRYLEIYTDDEGPIALGTNGTLRMLISGTTGQLTLPGYANGALVNVDSALYVKAHDATGDVWSIPVDSLGGGGAADGNGIYDAEGTVAPVVDMLVKLRADTTFSIGYGNNGYEYANNFNEPFFGLFLSESYQNAIGLYHRDDGNQYLGYIRKSPTQNAMSQSGYNGSTYTSTLSQDSSGIYLQGSRGAVSYFYGLPYTSPLSAPDTSIAVWVGATNVMWLNKSAFGGSGGAAQTLSTSNDSLTISGGNTVRVPGTGYVRDSVTTTTLTVDLANHSNAIVVLKMESATNLTLTINNPWSAVSGSYPNQSGETGTYSFHFRGIAGTDNVTWPAAFVDMTGAALGTDALVDDTLYTCFYDPVDAKYYCK